MFGKNKLERLGAPGHPTITPVRHHLLVIGLNYKIICLNRTKAFPTHILRELCKGADLR